MSNAIVKQQAEAFWTEEQRDLIKRTVARGATDDELAMFLHVAKKAGLDPLQRQIHFVKRKQNVGTAENPKWEDRVTFQAGIDGVQARASREEDYDGTLAGVVYDGDDFVFDHQKGEVIRHQSNPFKPKGQILGAWAITYRKGKKPFVALAPFAQYQDARSPFWKNKPSIMIEKVARFTSLRRAYPEQLGSVYEPSEMGRMSADEEKVTVETTAHTDAALPAATTEAAPETPRRPAPAELTHRQNRLRLLWAGLRARGIDEHGLPAFVKGILGEEVRSANWTDEQLGQLEEAVKALPVPNAPTGEPPSADERTGEAAEERREEDLQ